MNFTKTTKPSAKSHFFDSNQALLKGAAGIKFKKADGSEKDLEIQQNKKLARQLLLSHNIIKEENTGEDSSDEETKNNNVNNEHYKHRRKLLEGRMQKQDKKRKEFEESTNVNEGF